VAPDEAFAAIRERPTWSGVLVATIVLDAAGIALVTRAARAAFESSMAAKLATNPQIANLPPDQAAARIHQTAAAAAAFASYGWSLAIVIVPLTIAVETAILFGVRTLAGKRATFAQLFTLATYGQFIALGLGTIVSGIIVALRPVGSYRSESDFVTTVPSLAWLAPHAPPRLSAFLAMFGPFEIWGTIVLALGLVSVARFRPPAAWSTAVILLLAGAGWSAVFASS
jgi:hypothetical protein